MGGGYLEGVSLEGSDDGADGEVYPSAARLFGRDDGLGKYPEGGGLFPGGNGAIFDINIKRYRKIEKGETMPDAEILQTLYEKMQYSPLLVMDQKRFYLDN